MYGATNKGPGYIYFGATKFLLTSKIYSIRPLEVKNRSCRYVIYKKIDLHSYYVYGNDEDSILEKFKRPMEEEICELECLGSGRELSLCTKL
jgi:hypothetical protein